MQNDPNSLRLPTSAPSLPKEHPPSSTHDLQRQRHLGAQQQLVQVVHAHGAHGARGAAEEFRGAVALQQAPEGILRDGWPGRVPSGDLVSESQFFLESSEKDGLSEFDVDDMVRCCKSQNCSPKNQGFTIFKANSYVNQFPTCLSDFEKWPEPLHEFLSWLVSVDVHHPYRQT